MPLDMATAYVEHHEALFAWFRRRVPTREEADDLVSDTFVKALRYAPSYEDRGLPMMAWLVRVANSVLLDHLRHTRRSGWQPSQSLSDDLDSLGLAVPDGTPFDLDLLAAIERLTPQQRRVIILRYWEDMTVEEAARSMGVTHDGVIKLTARALGSIRRQLLPPRPAPAPGDAALRPHYSKRLRLYPVHIPWASRGTATP